MEHFDGPLFEIDFPIFVCIVVIGTSSIFFRICETMVILAPILLEEINIYYVVVY